MSALAQPALPSRVEGARMVQAAQAALQHRLASHATAVTLAPRHMPDAVVVPPGVVTLRVETEAAWAPSMRTLLLVEVEGKVVRRVPVWFAVRAEAPGLVAVRDLPAGHRIADDDLREAMVNLAAAGQARTDAREALTGLRLKHAVASGQPVLARHAEPMPDAQRGERIVVELQHPGIVISAPGIALADARTGQPVQVRMPSQRAIVTATVTGTRRARLSPEESTP